MAKPKAVVIVMDTNVYGWYLSYALDGSRMPEAVNSFSLISKILETKKPNVLGTETVEREIKEAGKPALSELFYSVVSGIKEKLRLVTADDCEIVAAAAVSSARIFVTENRKTLNNPKIVSAISKINKERKISNVKIMDSKSASGEIFA